MVDFLGDFPSATLSPPGQRVSASEFPTTPSTCHGTPSGCVSGFPDTPQFEASTAGKQYGEPFVICTPTMDPKAWQTIDQRISRNDVSFEVKEVKNIKDSIPEWDDDDVDEFMVLSPKRNPRTLGVITDSPTDQCTCLERDASVDILHGSDSAPQRVSAVDFEVIHRMAPPPGNTGGELVLGRKIGTAHLYAIKVFRKASLSTDGQDYIRARTEQSALRLIVERRIPFAPRLHWSFQDEKALYLVMGNSLGLSLRTCVERYGVFARDNAKQFAAEMVASLSALHAAGVVHRDMNPENVLVGKDGHVILSEFGCAKLDQGPAISQADSGLIVLPLQEVGPYQAPEVMLRWVHDQAADWWCFGMILCFMLTAKHAFMDTDDLVNLHPSILESLILHGSLTVDVSELLDPDAMDLISKCLERNPAVRISGEGVRRHAFFADMDWTKVSEIVVPAASTGLGFVREDGSENSRQFCSEASSPKGINEMLHVAASRNMQDGPGVVDGFSFTWELNDADSLNAQVSPIGQGNSQISVVASIYSELVTNSPRTQDTRSSKVEGHEVDIRIPAEFGGCPDDLPPPKKFGTLRKYSSLNFDMDTLESVPRSGRINPVCASPPSPARQIRKSQSIYASPFTQTSTGTRNKLRKKSRPESTPIPAYVQHPILDLPPGIEQIGNGIGYTRRVAPVYAHLSMSSLTPRACHGIFSGRRFSGATARHGRKKNDVGSGERFEHAGGGVVVMEGPNESEDQMNAVMQEMYGSRWNLGLSASELSHAGGADPRVYAALTRTSVGLGFGESALEMTRGGGMPMPPAELSTLSPDSTLRLVSPSSHGLDLEYC